MNLPRCLGWCVVCLLTTLAFPIAYDGSLSWLRVPAPLLERCLAAARNAVLVLFTFAVLHGRGRPRERSDAAASEAGAVVVVGRNVVGPLRHERTPHVPNTRRIISRRLWRIELCGPLCARVTRARCQLAW